MKYLTHDREWKINSNGIDPAPLKWRKPSVIRITSDIFGGWLHANMKDQVFAIMALTPQHTYQVVTDRPERMAKYFSNKSWGDVIVSMRQESGSLPAFSAMTIACQLTARYQLDDTWSGTRPSGITGQYEEKPEPQKMPQAWPLPNVHLGTNIKDQPTADARIPHLLRCPAAVRFLDCELTGPVHIRDANAEYGDGSCADLTDAPEGWDWPDGIHHVTVRGQTGKDARPVHPDWVRSIRDQCQAAGVPFFFKQWGEWHPGYIGGGCDTRIRVMYADGMLAEEKGDAYLDVAMPRRMRPNPKGGAHIVSRVGKKAAGRLLDGVEWNELPLAVAQQQITKGKR